jgi:GTP-binding protein
VDHDAFDDDLDAPFDPSEFVDEFGNAEPLPGEFGEDDGAGGQQVVLPVLAVVGRPNVGKSTLVNRILGRREAVVQDVPGVTRDRVYYEANWAGRRFTVVDTGGWEVDVDGMNARVAEQAEIAVELADAVVLVVDAIVGMTNTDEALMKVLRRSGKPVVLAANKVDNPQQEIEASSLWSLGLGEPHPVSAMHGRGSGDLLDAVLAALPETPAESFGAGALGGPPWSASPTSASPRCSTSSWARSGSWWTRRPAPPVTRWTN